MADWEGYGRRKGRPVRFCSQDCSHKAQIGRVAHNKGIPGKKWTEERKDNIIKQWKEKRKEEKGGKNWSGGYWSSVKLDILERDDYTCQNCEYREPIIMTVDHIIAKSLRPELRYIFSNLQTLCPNCHARKTIKDKKLIKELLK